MVKSVRTNTIKKFNKKHNSKYNYSKVYYIDSITKIEIICPEHGSFFQTPAAHMAGNGCPQCAKEKNQLNARLSRDEVIEKFNKAHNFKYNYSKVEYNGYGKKVTITCPKHGEFRQTAGNHIKGQGCPKCNYENQSLNKRKNIDEIKNVFNEVHNFKYDYSKVNYVNMSTKIEIICPEHGSFFQTPDNHRSGHGCPKCGVKRPSKPIKDVLKDFHDAHGLKYDYSKVEYVNVRQKVEIICPEHGSFFQTPDNHRCGHGCPKCSYISKMELELLDIVKNHDVNVKHNDRNIIEPLELDIYSEKYNFAIEYNGLMFHSFGKSKYKKFNNLQKDDPNKHLVKTEMCKSKNIKLLHIFENEYLDSNKRKIWLSIINGIMGLNKKITDFDVREIHKDVAMKFLEKNSLENLDLTSNLKYIGLFNNELLQVLVVRNNEVAQICSKIGYSITYDIPEIKGYFIYLNRRFQFGNNHLTFVKNTPLRCFYFKENENKLHNHEIPEGRKIYDCGLAKFQIL